MPRPGRLEALLEAALITLTLVAAPVFHRYTCNAVCAIPTLTGDREASSGVDGRHGTAGGGHGAATGGCCEASGDPAASKDHASGGCQCLDDCCSLIVKFTTPAAATDTGPATLVAAPAPASHPDESHRAPAPRLLPYPTGPPSAA